MKQLAAILPVLMLVLPSCKPEQNHYTPTPYAMEQPSYFPSKNNIPDNNPMTEEGVALGRKLFYDPRLSGRDGTDGIRSCSSCHHQEHNFEYGAPTNTHHAMLPLINLAWNRTGLGWNGSVATLEDMVWAAVTSPVEINADTKLRTNCAMARSILIKVMSRLPKAFSNNSG